MLLRKIAMTQWLLVTAAFLVNGCDNESGEDGTDTDADGDTDTDTADGAAGFNAAVAEEEAYWYSRYNLGALVMRSGLGETFMPEMEMVAAMVGMADANPDDGDVPMPPADAALLKSVYASGEPYYATEVDPGDFATQRWDPSSFDTAVTPRSIGWTAVKEVEWAKQFHVDAHFGTAESDFGAQWRFVGLVLAAEAQMQAVYALEMLRNEDGFIESSDGTLDFGGQWVFLEMLSDLGGLLATPSLPHSASNRHFDEEKARMFLDGADALFDVLAERIPADVEEQSLALQALVWYAAHTADAGRKAAAVQKIGTVGDGLSAVSFDGVLDGAYGVRGLIEAYRTTGDEGYRIAAADAFDTIAQHHDPATGTFDDMTVYTIDNVAVILGALNAARLFSEDAIDQDAARSIFTTFFESVVNKSGLQLSAPPKGEGKGDFENSAPDIYYAYPGMEPPQAAGGEFGIAPVFAGAATFSDGKWAVTDIRFDSAGAMHASNEMIWLHSDEVNGFPVI